MQTGQTRAKGGGVVEKGNDLDTAGGDSGIGGHLRGETDLRRADTLVQVLGGECRVGDHGASEAGSRGLGGVNSGQLEKMNS